MLKKNPCGREEWKEIRKQRKTHKETEKEGRGNKKNGQREKK